MAAPLPFSENELRVLSVLLKRKVRFMVVGLSAAALIKVDAAVKARVEKLFNL